MNQGQLHGLRRLHHHHHRLLEDDNGLQHPDPSPTSPSMPESASSLRRHVALLMNHHRPMERSNHAIQPVSPASYGSSSLELTPYNPGFTPSNGRMGGLKTSTELLKVLNRIWSLEEQHSSNIILVKGLKKELDRARVQIKDLLQDQVVDRQEIDELMRQIAEEKSAKKSKEQERMNSVIQSLKDQLEDEKKLRKRSESLHRKLAREVNEVKMKSANNLQELESEKKTNVLLEDLCDEFALGIRGYEQDLRSMRRVCNNNKNDPQPERNNQNRLIIHMCESWLDVREQMRQESREHPEGRAVDKLRDEIESFLEAKNIGVKMDNDNNPMNVIGVSVVQQDDEKVEEEEEDSHCFELLQKPNMHLENNDCNGKTMKKNQSKKSRSVNTSLLQVNFEEQMARARARSYTNNQEEISVTKTSEICDDAKEEEEGVSMRRNRSNGGTGSKINTIDNLIRNMSLDDDDDDQGVGLIGNSMFKNHASPVRKWAEKLPSNNDHEVSKSSSSSSSKLPPDLKENTLKSKLLEARTRGQRTRSRFKGIKDPI